jgi:AcrR family transcriptional regulator
MFQNILERRSRVCQDHAMAKAKKKRASDRREQALSRDRIVDEAIELLDAAGEDGLTFRELATRLATGAGAIYWHIASKSELLDAATDAVVARALVGISAHSTPKKAIRNIAVNVFETFDAHPWLGTQLARNPQLPAMLKIFERIGRQVQSLGVPRNAQFTAATVLVSYILGESHQNSANGRMYDPPPDRADFLEKMAAEWLALDPHEYPFTRSVAGQLRNHDDRAEFLAGIDFILAGLPVSDNVSATVR